MRHIARSNAASLELDNCDVRQLRTSRKSAEGFIVLQWSQLLSFQLFLCPETLFFPRMVTNCVGKIICTILLTIKKSYWSIYIYIYIGLGSIQNWSKLPENKFLYSIKISPINKPHLFLCVCLVAVHSYVTSNGKSRNSRRAFTATPPCLCACVTSNRGFDSWGSFSLWKYPHLQAVLCFHRLTARLEWHQLLLEQEKVRNKKNNFNTQASSWVTHCHDQMAYVQTDPHVKDFLITSFIDGTTETVSLCPCDSLVEEHREPAFIEFCCGESCVCVCVSLFFCLCIVQIPIIGTLWKVRTLCKASSWQLRRTKPGVIHTDCPGLQSQDNRERKETQDVKILSHWINKK